MSNTIETIDIAEKSRAEWLKKEIEAREADYAAMDSEEARKEDTKATYIRYMRQAEGNNSIWKAISAGLFLVFVAVLGYAILESLSGKTESSLWVVAAIVCAVCVLGISVILIRDIMKRNEEAKMRLSSHIHRYDMQLRHLRVEIDELKEQLEDLEKAVK